MDYKDTLLLPTTDFPMRGNLPQNEPARLNSWQNEREIYKKMKKNRASSKLQFTLHDGPPYANGHLHIGHALNKILKDIIIKTHYFMGESVRYVPGWDCHGLPIEQQVEMKLSKQEKQASTGEIRLLCREHAQEFVGIQSNEFKQLGIIGDFDNPYLTMKYEFEADIYRTLCEIARNGLLVERSKPVYWSWAAKTALAEAEVEYQDKEDYSIYVAFDLDDDALKKLEVESAKAVIWTTTPWTLPANQGISLKPDENYVLTSEKLIFASTLLQNLVDLGISKGEIIKEFKSNILENTHAINPLNSRKSIIMLGDHVETTGGTGLVHTAPGHGEDDYRVWRKYGFDEIIMPVDDAGLYDQTLRKFGLFDDSIIDDMIGVHIFKANEKILELLGNSLLHMSKFVHSYPFCWRTHKPVIYRATKQWFISMDEPVLDGKSLREVALKALEDVKFYPAVGRNRITSMIENRPDWCISRQRDWGVPIAFFRHKDTKEPIFDKDILDNIANIFSKCGADAWWNLTIGELLPPQCRYDADELEKVTDILDVWFDSGSTWNAVLKSGNYDAGEFPCDMYLEGSDQHRGWFQSSLLLSCAVSGKAPYKSVLTHGFTVDENGFKMSKSKGNVIAPQDVAKEYGVEILRLWVGLSDYSSELKISKNILQQVSEQYRKIRNTIRFLLANVYDLKEINTDFGLLDTWILSRAKDVFKEAKNCFNTYDFTKGFSILLNFLSSDLSGIYLDVCKDRLYCDDVNATRRRATQSAMAIITKSLLPLIAPTLTYTVDEVMQYAPQIIKGSANDAFDLCYEDLNLNIECVDIEHVLLAREKFFELIDGVKKNKTIKSALELNLQTTSEYILQNSDEIADLFTVSNITKFDEKAQSIFEFSIGDEKFKAVLSEDKKCPRCWKLNVKEGEVCQRCSGVVGV